jgi:hypothetical protein
MGGCKKPARSLGLFGIKTDAKNRNREKLERKSFLRVIRSLGSFESRSPPPEPPGMCQPPIRAHCNPDAEWLDSALNWGKPLSRLTNFVSSIVS